MSLIKVSDLSFTYEGSYDLIFDRVSFMIDTDWRLGFVGRNGRGKTTFLNLLMGKYEYSGNITAAVAFDYFPFSPDNPGDCTCNVIKDAIGPYRSMEIQMAALIEAPEEEAMEQYGALLEQYMALDGYTIDEMIKKELSLLDFPLEALAQPYKSLSGGEKTKVMLAALFLKRNNFLLIDEPTDHLDTGGRQAVMDYLAGKKGFILVSHDRKFLDGAVDHILAINRSDIEVMKGNFSTWHENKQNRDQFELNENEKLKKDIAKLTEATRRTAAWSDQVEASKIGQHVYDRGFVGHKAAKMMKRSKATQRRREEAAEEKSKLLKNIEATDKLKITPLPHHAKSFVTVENLSIRYDQRTIIAGVSFSVSQGERVSLSGPNGCGKSSIIKLLAGEAVPHTGACKIPEGLKISYVPQDCSFLKGSLDAFAAQKGVEPTLFKTILRKLDFSRNQFEKEMESFSQGQKKKVMIACSLSTRAHLYLWDEPLNYIDVISRMQIETLLKEYEPTMVYVEHDALFIENTATKTIELQSGSK